MNSTNKEVACAEMTSEQRENVEAMEKNQGYEFDGMDGFNVYMHNEELMMVVRIDSKGRAYAVN